MRLAERCVVEDWLTPAEITDAMRRPPVLVAASTWELADGAMAAELRAWRRQGDARREWAAGLGVTKPSLGFTSGRPCWRTEPAAYFSQPRPDARTCADDDLAAVTSRADDAPGRPMTTRRL